MKFGQIKPNLGIPINWGNPLAKGLVAYWLMNEGTGNTVQDLSGNGNIGTCGAAVTWAAGISGPSLYFPSQVNVTLPATITTAKTIIARVKVTADDNCAVCGVEDQAYYTPIILYDSLSRFYIGNGSGGSQQYWVYTAGSVEKWCTVAAVCDGTNAYAYIDGQSLGAGKVLTRLAEFNVLGNGHTYDFNGTIDYILAYDRALSASEIAKLYNNPFGIIQPTFSVWWYSGIGGEPPATAGQVIMISN